MERTRSPRPTSYRLAHVFLLVAVLAVIFGLVHSGLQRVKFDERYPPSLQWYTDPAVAPPQGRVWADETNLAAASFSGVILGGGLGMTAGVFWFRRVRGLFFGLAVGAVVGGSAGIISVCPPEMWALAIGCTAMIATAALLRLASL